MGEVSYKGHRYPAEIIAHCVWLYYRFPLSFREVEELMLVRGVIVSYETIRQWCAKFGPVYAAGLRRRRPRPGDKWHLDEVFVKINGHRQYLWRAVDQDGNVLDILVQPRRDAKAAKRFFRKLLTKQCRGASGAGHRQAPPATGGPSGGDAVGRAPAVEVPEQPGGELAPADPATRTRDERLPLARRSPTVPVRVQRHLAALPAPPPPAHRPTDYRTRDDRPLRRLGPDHRGYHDRRLNVNWDRAFHQNRGTTRGQ